MNKHTFRKGSKWRKQVATLPAFSRGLAVALMIAIIFQSVDIAHAQQATQPAPKVETATVKVQPRPYDGKTLYEALFFASGPLATKIPTVQKAAPYFPAEYKSLEPSIEKYILANNPTFFQNFANDIQSGNRVRVAAAIKSANVQQRAALIAVTKDSKTPLGTRVRTLGSAPEPDEPENDANVAVEVLVWVLVLVVAFLETPRPTELSGLTFDTYIDEIVRAVPKVPVVKAPIAPIVSKPPVEAR